MQTHSFSTCLVTIHPSSSFPKTPRIIDCNRWSIKTRKSTPSSSSSSSSSSSLLLNANSPNTNSTTLFGGGDGELEGESSRGSSSSNNDEDEGIETEIEITGNNSRRIRSRIAIEASLQTIWNILTDYERLPDFIPSLSLSQLIEKRPNFARLFQIGEQKLAFGLNFNAKGIVDCFEKDLEGLPFGQRRDIEFKMIEGDFKIFEGKWSIEQYDIERCEDGEFLVGQEFHTTLSYVVDVEPKLWLPVRLVEGRLSREIKRNLSCIRVEAQKGNHHVPVTN